MQPPRARAGKNGAGRLGGPAAASLAWRSPSRPGAREAGVWARALALIPLVAAGSFCEPGSPDGPGASGPRPRPNVLFIAIDDLNDWVGALGGHPQAHTPHIDRLAERGLLFSNAHTPAPACNPARAAILSGWWPHRSGIYGNGQPWRPVMPDVVTLPEHFKANGYKTLGSGKIYHGPYSDPASWDEYHPALDRQSFGESPVPRVRPVNGIPDAGSFDWGPLPDDDAAMDDWRTASWVARQLARASDRPFFLACGFIGTHRPWYVPAPYFERYPMDSLRLPVGALRGDLADVPEVGSRMVRGRDHRRVVQYRQWEAAVRGYLASIEFVDRQVGRVLDALDSGPHADDTIVVLWSDHGMHLGEKQHWGKYSLWERATRVPLVIAAPGVTRPGTRSDRPVNLVDLYPTLIDLAGLPQRDPLDGVSLRTLLEDPEAAWTRPSLTTWGPGNHAIRSQHWRYIRYHDGGEELYDHRVDPHEWRNLADRPGSARTKAGLAVWLPRAEAEEAPFETPDHPRPSAWPRRRRPVPGAPAASGDEMGLRR